MKGMRHAYKENSGIFFFITPTIFRINCPILVAAGLNYSLYSRAKMFQAFYTTLSYILFGLLLFLPLFIRQRLAWNLYKPITWRFLPNLYFNAKKRVHAWMFLIRGPSLIQEEYDKSGGSPFWIQAPENRYLVISSWDHIKEIDAAPEDVLSLQAAAKEILQPRYTMQNFDWLNKKGVDGTPLVRTLRTLLTNHLPEILPDARRSMSALFDDILEPRSMANGSYISPLFPMVIEAIALTNATAFFGKDLARDKIFMSAAMNFIEQTLITAEVVRVLPSTIAPFIGNLMSKKLGAGKTIYNALIPIAEDRLEERTRQSLGQNVSKHHDCIQWVMECSPRSKPWSAERIVHELMALWFGSVHITSTTACFALHHLCIHSEYIEPLRNEIESTGWAKFEKSGGRGFPLLDSFMKESARMNPVESVSSRRMALKPFQLSDGSRIEPGEWICTAPRGMMSDARFYTDPLKFQGFRFVDPDLLNRKHSGISNDEATQDAPSKFTDINHWQLWGTGRSACPGRFYATAVMKTLLALFITRYDMQLEDPKAARSFAWRTFIYPYASTKVILHRRSAE
ncbi:cytochrome P450 [Trichoderma chlorosporum]